MKKPVAIDDKLIRYVLFQEDLEEFSEYYDEYYGERKSNNKIERALAKRYMEELKEWANVEILLRDKKNCGYTEGEHKHDTNFFNTILSLWN